MFNFLHEEMKPSRSKIENVSQKYYQRTSKRNKLSNCPATGQSRPKINNSYKTLTLLPLGKQLKSLLAIK